MTREEIIESIKSHAYGIAVEISVAEEVIATKEDGLSRELLKATAYDRIVKSVLNAEGR